MTCPTTCPTTFIGTCLVFLMGPEDLHTRATAFGVCSECRDEKINEAVDDVMTAIGFDGDEYAMTAPWSEFPTFMEAITFAFREQERYAEFITELSHKESESGRSRSSQT